MSYLKEQFERDYQLSADDVNETLKAIGIKITKDNYSDSDQKKFAEARKMFNDGIAQSYDDIQRYFQPNNYSKEQFESDYQLSANDVNETLKAIGLKTNKKNYSHSEREKFAEARKMLNEGLAKSYDEIQQYFQSNPQEANGNSPNGSEPLAELQKQAVQMGFEMGIRQAQIMGEVIPQVTVMRLKEMIDAGELKDNFRSYWQKTVEGGKPIEVEELLEEHWTTYQVEKYQAPTNLLPSSTESSDNGSNSP